jgi:hypothetical protein
MWAKIFRFLDFEIECSTLAKFSQSISMNAVQGNTPKILSGILFSNFISVVLVGSSKVLSDSLEDSGVLIFSNFIVVPLLMGIVCAYCWRSAQMKTTRYVLWAGANTLIAIVLSAIFLREGSICLLIVSPLIFGFMVAGVSIGRVMFRNENNTMLKSSVFGILLLIFIADTFSEHQNINIVSDTILVNAPIEKVWPFVVEYEPIKTKESYWLFLAGMPSPVQSTVDGYEVGAGRKCIFSNGYVFDEKMVVYKPNEELTFDIIGQPHDPEIMGHIEILRGQFILKDNGDGTTMLIGNSWYKLYVFPTWYFNIWAKSITRNVHLRVMDHIKILSEENV